MNEPVTTCQICGRITPMSRRWVQLSVIDGEVFETLWACESCGLTEPIGAIPIRSVTELWKNLGEPMPLLMEEDERNGVWPNG